MGTQSTAFSKRDVYIIITTAFVAATLMISTSVWGTSIGTDVTVTGTLAPGKTLLIKKSNDQVAVKVL